MPFNKELKSLDDVQELIEYEIIEYLQLNIATEIVKQNKDKLFAYYVEDALNRLEDNCSYNTFSFISDAVNCASEDDKWQMVYDNIEITADDIMNTILKAAKRDV